jgi:biopolymer transport protein ExbB/TolQ
MIAAEYLMIGLGLLMLYIIYFVMSKDAQQSRQIHTIATAVEELNHRLFDLEKELNARLQQTASDNSPEEHAAQRREMEQQVRRLAGSLSGSVGAMEEGFAAFKSDMEKRLAHLEEGMRHLTMPSSVSGMDDERIIDLYKQGVTMEAIAKELRLSKAEVEFVLKINKIR